LSNVLLAADSAIGVPNPASANGWIGRSGWRIRITSNRSCTRGSAQNTDTGAAPVGEVFGTDSASSASGTSHFGRNAKRCETRPSNVIEPSRLGWNGALSM
jgi:hypothetical protein